MKQTERLIYGVGFLVVVGVLSASVWLQVVKQIMPCLLCVMQRLCFAGIGCLFLFGFLFPNSNRLKWLYPIGSMGLSLAGLYFSGRQIWLQSVSSTDSQAVCGVSFDYLFEILPWHDFLNLVLSGNHECARHTFFMMGLDLSAWSALSFLFFLLMSLWIIKKLFTHKDVLA